MTLIATLILTVLFFIWPVFLPSGAFGESPPDAAEKAAPQMPFIKEAGELYHGRFPLKKVGSHYESEPRNEFEQNLKIHDEITIPWTEIRAGVFHYEYINERGEKNFQPKSGLIINDSIYYVESSDKKGWEVFDMGGNPHFKIYKDYLAMDACAAGASDCNRRMFLFWYTKESVELLDIIMAPFIGKEKNRIGLDFMPAFKDDLLDNDGNPLFKVWISHSYKFEEAFGLFFKIKDDKFQLDLTPELYKPLFKEVERESKNKKQKPDAYYVYGFLSGKLSLKKIKTMLTGEEKTGEKEHYIISILNARKTWNAEFHNLYGVKPVLIRHNLKRETGGK